MNSSIKFPFRRAGLDRTVAVQTTPSRSSWLRLADLLLQCSFLLTAFSSGAAYWDLRFQIVGAPTNVLQCGTASWAVQVRNAGNAISDNVCFFTGIGLHRGASNWTDNLGFVYFSSGNIPAGQTRTFYINNYIIPCGASTGRQYVKVEINYGVCHDYFYAGNYDVEPLTVERGYWDLQFELLNLPTNGITCSSVDWAVRVRNAGNLTSQNVCFFTGIGHFAGASNWNQNLGLAYFTSGNIGPGQSQTFYVNNYFIPCDALLGQQYVKTEINYTVGCSDVNTAGNYAEAPIPIQRGFWDLQFQILNSPATGFVCSNASWDVHVTNVGNLPSANVCFLTGIDLNSGAGSWARNLGLVFLSSGNIAPEQSRTFNIENYRISCLAVQTQQFIKAEINYTAGCFDLETGGNYTETPIQIRVHPDCPYCPIASTLGPPPDNRPLTNQSYYGYLNVRLGPPEARTTGAGYIWVGVTNPVWYTTDLRFLMEPDVDFTLGFSNVPSYLRPPNATVKVSSGTTNNFFGLYRMPGHLEWSTPDKSNLWLRGSQGSTYRIDSTPRLDPSSVWSLVLTQRLAEDRTLLTNLPPFPPTNGFLRAVVMTNVPPPGVAP